MGTNRLIPPLTLSKEHVDQAVETMKDAVAEAAMKYEEETMRKSA